MISITWGQSDARCNQGWMHPVGRHAKGLWTAHWSTLWDTFERDGAIEFKENAWRSENNLIVGYPFAVMNDFGYLVPV